LYYFKQAFLTREIIMRKSCRGTARGCCVFWSYAEATSSSSNNNYNNNNGNNNNNNTTIKMWRVKLTLYSSE
jgi:hypothetical protein